VGRDEDHLEKRLLPVQERETTSIRPPPDMIYIRHEWTRRPVTMPLLWEEYRGREPQGYSYSRYGRRYRDGVGTWAASLRREHRAGEPLSVDDAGDTLPSTDSLPGDLTRGQWFVAVLGCRNTTYADVTSTPPVPDGIGAPVNALEAIDGVPQIVVPDNPKTAVTHPCGYDPDLHLTDQEMAEHYGCAV
jgi:transposase